MWIWRLISGLYLKVDKPKPSTLTSTYTKAKNWILMKYHKIKNLPINNSNWSENITNINIIHFNHAFNNTTHYIKKILITLTYFTCVLASNHASSPTVLQWFIQTKRLYNKNLTKKGPQGYIHLFYVINVPSFFVDMNSEVYGSTGQNSSCYH